MRAGFRVEVYVCLGDVVVVVVEVEVVVRLEQWVEVEEEDD